jgi:hypothetical protein
MSEREVKTLLPGEDSNMNAPGMASPWYAMPATERLPCYCPVMPSMMAGAMAAPMVYPDVYYKIQPFILKACDEMPPMAMPSQEMMDRMADHITDNVCRVYPELAQYAQENAAKPMAAYPIDGDEFMRRRGRRGFLGDLISILLFSEFFRRRRF